VAGALVVDDAGRIFFQKRSATRTLFPNTWDVVGGHVEAGETLHDTLQREVTEETGWELTVVLGEVGDYTYTGEDGRRRIETDFLVRVDGDLDRPRLEVGKHTEFRWLGPDDLAVLDENREINDGMIRRIAEDGFAVLRMLGL
jgi:8-oxo-dGTP diphosphatase